MSNLVQFALDMWEILKPLAAVVVVGLAGYGVIATLRKVSGE